MIALVVALAFAQAEPSSPAEDLALATMLVRDGNSDRAAPLLEQLDPNSEDIDAVELHRLRGIVALKLDKPAAAAKSFAAALAAGDTESRTHLLLADAHLRAKQPEQALAVVRAAPPGARKFPELFLAEALACHQLDDKEGAYAALSAGLRAFGGHRVLHQRRLLLLVELGLAHTAIEQASAPPEGQNSADDFLMLAAALRQAGRPDEAAELLEQGRLLFPEEQTITTQLALSYHEGGHHLSAAELLAPLALLEQEHALFAAELYRQAGQLPRAVRHNARIADQKKKLRQRLSLLIEGQRWELAAQLEERLERLGLLVDEDLVYALAYAHFRVGQHQQSERLLSMLQRPELFERAMVLRRAMARCANSTGGCS